MTGILLFIKELFGINNFGFPQSEAVKREKNIKKALTKVQLPNLEDNRVAVVPWWETPIIKDESAEFEEIENTVLYDELEITLKESRLEVIEIPETISAVLGIIHRKHFWYSEVVELIERSPVLTGDFLSIVNSAAFSRGIFIYDLSLALPRLGRTKIQSILFLNASKMSLPETPLFKSITEEIISESQVVAKICRILSPVFRIDSSEAFLSGLLHNIGKIGLLKQIHKHYNLPDDLDIEYHQTLFKNIIPHFENKASRIIGEYWKLDKKTINVISRHNELDRLLRDGIRGPVLQLAALVNLSVYLARIMGYGESVIGETKVFDQQSCKILNFTDTPANRALLTYVHDSFQEEDAVEEDVA